MLQSTIIKIKIALLTRHLFDNWFSLLIKYFCQSWDLILRL